MSTTQDQIEAIARECAVSWIEPDAGNRLHAESVDELSKAILTAANRIFDLRKDEYARQYAALKVQAAMNASANMSSGIGYDYLQGKLRAIITEGETK